MVWLGTKNLRGKFFNDDVSHGTVLISQDRGTVFSQDRGNSSNWKQLHYPEKLRQIEYTPLSFISTLCLLRLFASIASYFLLCHKICLWNNTNSRHLLCYSFSLLPPSSLRPLWRSLWTPCPPDLTRSTPLINKICIIVQHTITETSWSAAAGMWWINAATIVIVAATFITGNFVDADFGVVIYNRDVGIGIVAQFAAATLACTPSGAVGATGAIGAIGAIGATGATGATGAVEARRCWRFSVTKNKRHDDVFCRKRCIIKIWEKWETAMTWWLCAGGSVMSLVNFFLFKSIAHPNSWVTKWSHPSR